MVSFSFCPSLFQFLSSFIIPDPFPVGELVGEVDEGELVGEVDEGELAGDVDEGPKVAAGLTGDLLVSAELGVTAASA